VLRLIVLRLIVASGLISRLSLSALSASVLALSLRRLTGLRLILILFRARRMGRPIIGLLRLLTVSSIRLVLILIARGPRLLFARTPLTRPLRSLCLPIRRISLRSLRDLLGTLSAIVAFCLAGSTIALLVTRRGPIFDRPVRFVRLSGVASIRTRVRVRLFALLWLETRRRNVLRIFVLHRGLNLIAIGNSLPSMLDLRLLDLRLHLFRRDLLL
jgi:hypothetical protein